MKKENIKEYNQLLQDRIDEFYVITNKQQEKIKDFIERTEKIINGLRDKADTIRDVSDSILRRYEVAMDDHDVVKRRTINFVRIMLVSWLIFTVLFLASFLYFGGKFVIRDDGMYKEFRIAEVDMKNIGIYDDIKTLEELKKKRFVIGGARLLSEAQVNDAMKKYLGK